MKKLFIVVNNDKFFLSHRKPIAIGAKQAGYDVTVVTKFTGLQDQITALGLKVISMPMNSTGMNPKEELQTLNFLLGLYSRERPDIVHHVGLKPVLWGTAAARFSGIRNVVNAISGTGFLFSPDNRSSLSSRLVVGLLKMVSGKNVKYIFQNKDDEREFVASGISTHPQSVFIKGSGVDLNQFAYVSEDNKDNSVLKFVFTGRMIAAKGVLVIAEAARMLKKNYGDKIQFLLCGDLDKNPTALKQNEIEALCDGEYVKWLGFQKDIYSILKTCHVMIFPSFYMEGLPKSVIDAEAAGLPVITTDWVGCRDTVEDGVNGFMIEPKSASALAEKVAILADDDKMRRLMGVKAREYAEKYFSIENVVQKHIEVYDSFTVVKRFSFRSAVFAAILPQAKKTA